MQKNKNRFPDYFAHFTMPKCAKEQILIVYRACPTYKIEKASFLNTYEEKQGKLLPEEVNNPSSYSLSTYTKVNDLRRFCALTSKYSPPYPLAKGTMSPEYGICAYTKDVEEEMEIPKKERTKTSHVDCWLYVDAEPWKSFEEVNYEDEYKHNDKYNKEK